MLDRVREALFSTLGERVDGARVLDLFAGSGSLGLEALSRGAVMARMVEHHPRAYATLKENVELLGVADRSLCARGNALTPDLWRPLHLPSEEPIEAEAVLAMRADVVFFDPPYAMLEDPLRRAALIRTVETLANDVMTPEGVLVFHAPLRSIEKVYFERARAVDLRAYGGSALCYIERLREGDTVPEERGSARHRVLPGGVGYVHVRRDAGGGTSPRDGSSSPPARDSEPER